MKRYSLPAFVPVSGILALAALIYAWLAPPLLQRYGEFGTIDFIQYHSAFQLLVQGKNPYDSFEMYALQQQLGQKPDHVIMMWNPPWLLTIMAPVLMLAILEANFAWLLLNFVALLFILEASARAAGTNRPPLSWNLLGVAFMPFYAGLSYGQASVIPALGMALFCWAVTSKRDTAAGLSLALCSVKPHLFIVAAPFLLGWIIRERRYSVITGAAAGIAVLVAPIVAWNPGAILDWARSFSSVLHPAVIPVESWKVATIGNVVRMALAGGGAPPAWPIWAVPLVSAFLAAVYVLVRRPVIDINRHALPLLALSIICSPYGWYYDQTLLLTGQILLLAASRARGTGYRLTVVLLWAVQINAVIAQAVFETGQHQFVWMPLALTAVWFIATRRT